MQCQMGRAEDYGVCELARSSIRISYLPRIELLNSSSILGGRIHFSASIGRAV